MRRAELIMALVMALFSVYLMWKSTELPIGWLSGEGPGGGAFPFWLALGMLLSSVWTMVRWCNGSSQFSQSDEPYFGRDTLRLFFIGAGALTVMIGLIHVVGVYVSSPLFLIFYMRFLGRHSWITTAALAVMMPIVTFIFFEIMLKITLPKGWTEPLFYPLYDLIY